ncbi:HK97 family phage prohead protease [Bosea sp. (in: a-proteobacteria)]|uniref:HK97 family phage prohead protease n=1 Tax=Bosea sp. (in: a-proteobacteria) TaxID=1871050 RepID=UPI002735F634|nr:HK97 family phage prohead protease [Bosea sp. (in: a-proteobacteria)]MDP3408079.1 HK97 family phage prohead protease [Bosea sp. (in: a-proteobacteria)]
MTQSAAISEPTETHQRNAPAVRFDVGERYAQIKIGTRGSNSYDPETRTFEFVLATETPCESYRYEGWDAYEVDEVLLMRGLEDIESLVGAPILNSHNRYSLNMVVGVIIAARVQGKKLVCTGKLSAREEVADIVRDIADGILTKMSVGYRRLAETEKDRIGDKPLVTVDRWRAMEASIVAVPADTNASIRSGDKTMAHKPTKTRAAETEAEMTEEEKAKLAAAEAEESGETEEERSGVLAAVRSALAGIEAALSGRAAPKADAKPTAVATPARDAAVEALRGVAKRNGRSEDFEGLVTAGAEIAELRAIAVSAIRTNSVEIAARSSKPVPDSGAREQLSPFSETAAGKRLAARAAATR